MISSFLHTNSWYIIFLTPGKTPDLRSFCCRHLTDGCSWKNCRRPHIEWDELIREYINLKKQEKAQPTRCSPKKSSSSSPSKPRESPAQEEVICITTEKDTNAIKKEKEEESGSIDVKMVQIDDSQLNMLREIVKRLNDYPLPTDFPPNEPISTESPPSMAVKVKEERKSEDDDAISSHSHLSTTCLVKKEEEEDKESAEDVQVPIKSLTMETTTVKKEKKDDDEEDDVQIIEMMDDQMPPRLPPDSFENSLFPDPITGQTVIPNETQPNPNDTLGPGADMCPSFSTKRTCGSPSWDMSSSPKRRAVRSTSPPPSMSHLDPSDELPLPPGFKKDVSTNERPGMGYFYYQDDPLVRYWADEPNIMAKLWNLYRRVLAPSQRLPV